MVRSFKRWLGRFLPSCEEATLMISKSIDTKLPLWDQILMRLHQWTCVLCRRYEDQIVFVRSSVRQGAEQLERTASEALSPDAKERISSALRQPPQG